ncbi:FkbM family methyltransferase [Pararhizobium capsulatum DSM 1112]|uniref:FkbM family methyltransferase n=1 Tax=Pararhizobium capsulatum DSM 1112 TaxID=1121113 RepID=A0ABU0BTA1_9HYPH|nr:FkbM family methyltransferase [Pararhizobium capsulatum]MDQ0321479.1 FkbM family methyltransferase [Pararhizobium capsulatum DSM 1112]
MTKTTDLLRKRFRKWRNRLARRFLNTRTGRDMLIASVSPRVITMTADCGDHVMTFSPHDYVGHKIYRKGHFERDHVDRLLAILKEKSVLGEGRTLLELGGNIGTQTIYFALSKAFDHIVSVEPDPRNFALLETNIAQNNLSSRITAVNCAAGETEGEIAFFQHQANHGKSSAIRQSAGDIEMNVPVRPIGAILAQAGVDASTVGLIWMDIEGYEPIACRSMEALMARRVPLYMEFSPTFYGREGTRAFAAQLARFYEDCIVFHEDERTVMKVKNIPLGEEQFDLFLMP